MAEAIDGQFGTVAREARRVVPAGEPGQPHTTDDVVYFNYVASTVIGREGKESPFGGHQRANMFLRGRLMNTNSAPTATAEAVESVVGGAGRE
jgi:hypothetical protein